MMTQKTNLLLAIVFALLFVMQPADAKNFKVETQKAYKAALKKVKPGDTIVLANGRWEDFEILFTANGEPDRPITLTAETKGKVLITGRSNLRLAGEHLVVSGLVFTDGYSPTNTVIAFRRTKGELAFQSRVTEVVIDHFNNPERFETDFWVMMYGQHNRFDHNHLEGKSNQGVTMAVRLDSEDSRENYHRIDHNYFGPRPTLGSNGGETLRIGTSHHSLSNSFTTVENNYFDRCNGEVEIISSKSGSNEFRGNIFFESKGTLTLRHGNNNLVEGNVFFGNGVDHTGGIRVINAGQIVRNNYLEGLSGHRFGGGLVIMNGVPDSPINRYHQVADAKVENNSIISVEHIELAAGSDAERSAPPIRSSFASNMIYNEDRENNIQIHDDISGVTFTDNALNDVATPAIDDGFTNATLTLVRADNGLLYPVDESVTFGAARDLAVVAKDQTGPNWYSKPGPDIRFDTGKTHSIEPGEDALFNVVAAAASGDVIGLQPGDYQVAKIIALDKPITLKAEPGSARVQFERTALFEIREGGSLKLSGLNISGASAPDNAGNSMIRTSRYSMLANYALVIENCEISDLDTNHSFNFFTVAKHTFADDIRITNSSFSDVTGHILALNQEIDDLGIYNAEYITILGTTFENVDGSIAHVYRGGTDESTFGPHFEMRDTEMTDVGFGKRNKTKASVSLLGAQRVDIDANLQIDSQPLRIVETVGEPVIRVGTTLLSGTPDPVIVPFGEK